MVFDYYARLSKKQQSIYRESDAISHVAIANPADLRNSIASLELALQSEDVKWTESLCKEIMDTLATKLHVPKLRIRVLLVRPSDDRGELHGLYEPVEDRNKACITVWMRTVSHKRVVAFKTFLRTLLHEFCHHLDYELFQLHDSFHTEGFFKRESTLFKQLM